MSYLGSALEEHYQKTMHPSTDDFGLLTFPRLNLRSNTLEDNNLALKCPLHNGHIQSAPQQDLGALSLLVLELLQEILI